MKKEFAIGSNGYLFIDRIRVDEETFYRERVMQQLDDIEEKIDEINKILKL